MPVHRASLSVFLKKSRCFASQIIVYPFASNGFFSDFKKRATIVKWSSSIVSQKKKSSAAKELLPQAEELLFRNFHRALKARCMNEHGAIPLQVIRKHTYQENSTKQND